MSDFENSYWGSNGPQQDLYEKLNKLIPMSGDVFEAFPDKPKKDLVKLEALRLAANQYYDLYNNGLGNRPHGFAKRFGVDVDSARRVTKWSIEAIDARMTEFILAAAEEQGLGDEKVVYVVTATEDFLGDLDGYPLTDVIKQLQEEIDEKGPSVRFYFDRYGYDGGFEIKLRWERPENEDEKKARLAAEQAYKKLFEKKTTKKEAAEREQYEYLKKKFG